MREEGIVKRMVLDKIVEVQLASGEGCRTCSCRCQESGTAKTVEAANEIGAVLGERVEVEISSSKLLGAFLLIYILPLLFLLAGYGMFSLIASNEGLKILGAFLGLVFGLMLVRYLGSRNREIAVRIVARLTQ
jgi:sigma-E factor negative regulatory protein RseC